MAESKGSVLHSPSRALWDWLLLTAIVAMVVQFILLIVRLDLSVNISYFIIAIPAWVLAFLGTGFGLYLLVINAMRGHKIKLLEGLILLFLSQGFGWSQFSLALKFQNTAPLSYWEALLPFFIFVGLAFIPIVAVLVMMTDKHNGLRKRSR